MPQPYWNHVCYGLREVLRTSPECGRCARRGAFVGWRLAWWEALRVYHYVYSLNPIGPHRDLADRLFAGMRNPCIRCGGRAVLTLGDGSAWRSCPECEGTGGIWTRPFAEIDAARRQVVARWPSPGTQEPAMRSDTPTGASRGAVHDRVPHSDAGSQAIYERGREAWAHATVRARHTAPRRSAIPRRKGYSSHGLKLADVQRAFAEAEQLLGTTWQLKGRGHCRRVSLDARYSTYAARGAARSWAWITPHGSMSARRLMPRAIVKQAAKVLGVPARVLISREF